MTRQEVMFGLTKLTPKERELAINFFIGVLSNDPQRSLKKAAEDVVTHFAHRKKEL